MNHPLSKKLIAYTSLTSAMLVAAKLSSGQIVYHDFNPDESLSGFSHFDLDNDGIYDLAFNNQHLSELQVYNSQNYYKISCTASIRASSYNSLAGNSSGLAQLNAGDVVDENLPWMPSATFLLGYLYRDDLGGIYNVGGNWNFASDKFFGFRLKNAGATYYGWMRMSLDGNGCGVTLNDYAINNTPDQLITAGDTGFATGMKPEEFDLKPRVYFENSLMFVEMPSDEQGEFSYTITDILGRRKFECISASSSTIIPVGNLSPGAFLLVISNSCQRCVIQFVKS